MRSGRTDESTRLPWWSGLLTIASLIGVVKGIYGLDYWLWRRIHDTPSAFWLRTGIPFLFMVNALMGFDFLARRVRSRRWIGVLLIIIGGLAWFLGFVHIGPLQIIGPWSDRFAQLAETLLGFHPYVMSFLRLYFFVGIALLVTRRNEAREGFPERRPWIASLVWLVFLIIAYFVTTERSPISLLSSMGPFGHSRLDWIAKNILDVRGFILDSVLVAGWLSVSRAVRQRRWCATPWIACGLALLVLAVLPAFVSSPSFAFRQFFSQLAFWFGGTSWPSATMSSVGLLAILFGRRTAHVSASG